MNDEEILKKSFKLTEDKRLIVKAPFVRVYMKEDFFNHKIAELIGNEITTIGIFYMDIFGLDDDDFDISEPKNGKRVLLKMPMDMILCPSNIDEMRDENKDLVKILEFQEGDTFIKTTLFLKSWKTASKLVDLMLKGFLPKELGYDEIVPFFLKCCELNDFNSQIADTILEILVAELCRDPSDLAKPFRMAIAKNPNIKMTDKQFVKIDNLGRLYNTFAAISSGDTKQGITTSINRKRYNKDQKESVIEEALSDV